MDSQIYVGLSETGHVMKIRYADGSAKWDQTNVEEMKDEGCFEVRFMSFIQAQGVIERRGWFHEFTDNPSYHEAQMEKINLRKTYEAQRRLYRIERAEKQRRIVAFKRRAIWTLCVFSTALGIAAIAVVSTNL